MEGDADSKAAERLRALAQELSSWIFANPPSFSETARWLLALPRCRHATHTTTAVRGELVLLDDEDAHVRSWGPICRRLEDAWACATYHFPPGADRFIDFGLEDAKRLALLAALTFDKDFDGAELGLSWSWERPIDSSAHFDGRSWAWSMITRDPGSEAALLDYVEAAARMQQESAKQLARPSSAAQSERWPLSDQARAMYKLLCALPETEARRAKELVRELREQFPGIDDERIRRLAQELRPYGLDRTGSAGYFIPRSERPESAGS